ncbi:hypothetical protein [Gracilimonas sp.]|uniref:hypothetical protein n=1 Tax=Gracilimonas sp. TaxID=1974203 RepID=UPI00287100B9|nr:hypothetical protein [Gracilimonas sp.]
MKNLFICFFFALGILTLFQACDSTNSPNSPLENSPFISDFSISPSIIEFQSGKDEFKDTTVAVTLSASVQDLIEEDIPRYVIVDKRDNEILYDGELNQVDGNNFERVVNIETNTTSFEQYIINLFIADESGAGNYAQGKLTITGLSNNPPEILEVNNPEEYERPSSGSEDVQFTAKVTDVDGQNSISGVFLRLISQTTGEVANSPFRLFDDGTSLGDQVANDSVYTLTFPVSSTNQLQTYDILYYAIDQGGLVSDTVKTTFSIVE